MSRRPRRSRSPSDALPLPDVDGPRPALPHDAAAGGGSPPTAAGGPGSAAIARYSGAIATQSSVSAITAGLHAIGSRSTAKPSAVPTPNGEKPSRAAGHAP